MLSIYRYENLDEWLDLIRDGEAVHPRFKIPYQEWLDDYISSIDQRSENEVKELLRYLLFPFTRPIDRTDYKDVCFFIQNQNTNEDVLQFIENAMEVEKNRRIENGQEAWEGLTWILQLLPFAPYKAIKALNSYLDAEVMYMPDDRIIGISQCIELIEAKFINTTTGLESTILKLKPREFEWLIEILYNDIGYETKLTPATRDGGKDIIAQINREDGRETVYVECKLYKSTKLKKETVRAFAHTVIKDNINRGVLFCTGYVSEKLKEVDSRIQIWSLEEIIILLNAHIGSDWNYRLCLLIENQKRKYKK